jgi:hypothetical protein
MENKRFFIIGVLLALIVGSAFSQDFNKGGILYGRNWACIVSAPDGWIMDSDSLSGQGIYGLFYEEGKKFGSQYNTPIIYIVTLPLQNATDNALNAYIQSDINNYIANGSKVLQLDKSYKETDRIHQTYNVDLSNGRYETFVFTRYKEYCFLIILNANNNEQRNELFPKLAEVINSLSFLDRTE